MNIWAAIKYALNSTLGTPNFKPLNELIEAKSVIKSIQRGTAGGFSYTGNTSSDYRANIDIVINNVNPSNCRIHITPGYVMNTQAQYSLVLQGVPYSVNSLAEGTLSIQGFLFRHNTATTNFWLAPFSWEIVEYY